MTFDRWDVGLTVGLGLLAGLAYGRTCVREMLPSDGSEFQLLALERGHAHVTGYAVYLALLRAFASVSVGEPILRATFFSAVMGGAAAALAYLIGRAVAGWRVCGLALVGAWAGSTIVLSQAVQAEVYTTASVFTASVFLLVFRWLQDRADWRLLLAGILGGLSIGVHGSIGLFAPGIGLALLQARIGWRSLGAALLGVVVGLLLFSGCFLLADRAPRAHDSFATVYHPWATAFGSDEEQLSHPLQRMGFLLEANQWKKSMWADPSHVAPAQAYVYLRTLFRDFTLPWLVLAALGLLVAFRRSRSVLLLLAIGLLCHHYFTFTYDVSGTYVFFIPAFLYVSISAAIGAGALLDACQTRSRVWLVTIAGFVLAAACSQVGDKFEYLASRGTRGLPMDLPPREELARQFAEAREVIRALPPNSFVATDWDILYRMIHAAELAGRRDLQFIEARPWSIENMSLADYRARLAQLSAGRPLYLGISTEQLAEVGYRGALAGRVAEFDIRKIADSGA